MSDAFDFVIVGGGTAGCLLGQRLASSTSRISVLLIEIGDDNSDISTRVPFDRFSTFLTRPELDHGYSTVPQSALKNREVPYPRGKGLGGSTATNCLLWAPGSSMDYDRWAELVGDENWGWEKTNARFKAIQFFHGTVPPTLQNYANPVPEDHGYSGSVDISIPDEWEPETQIIIDAAAKFGFPLNLDPTTGNPIGIGLLPNSTHAGLRTTSASAHLSSRLTNLTVWTKTRVIRVVLDGKRAVGVDLADGHRVTANQEVILCAGAIDTPKLLLLSGIGPAEELARHNIELCHDLPGVGKNLQDHAVIFVTEHLGHGFSSKINFMSTPAAVDSARQEWLEFQTGPLTTYFQSGPIGCLKDDSIYKTEAFSALDPEMQRFLRHPLVPQYELGWGAPLFDPTYQFEDINDSFLSTIIVGMNPVSRGTVTISSSNPQDPPLIDFAFLSHPLDKLTLTAAIRKSIHFNRSQPVQKFWKSHINAPRSDSDEDIWNFIADNCGPLWHANGSVMMSKSGEELGCVDSSLKVFGIEGLRVADTSVCPLTPNGHTQATAYLIGQVAAEKICLEHHLDISGLVS